MEEKTSLRVFCLINYKHKYVQHTVIYRTAAEYLGMTRFVQIYTTCWNNFTVNCTKMMLTSMKHVMHVSSRCEILHIRINIRQLWNFSHFSPEFSLHMLDLPGLNFHLGNGWFFHYFYFVRHSLNNNWSDSVNFSNLGSFLFASCIK